MRNVDSEQICAELVDFVRNEILADPAQPIDPEVNLFASGLVDSMGVMRLIGFIEERFHVKIPPADLVPSNFRTLQITSDYLADLIRQD